ncbi:MAG: O-antigen translocase [Muribaculaceae bacterium]|nr:O-antigen translocase [Muribaculaceae bacterium]
MASLITRSIELVKRAIKADIVKVFSLTSISTLVKMCTGLISVKVVASIIGPAGVALVGQLNNFATIVMSFASGGINSGITKYVAEYKDDDGKITQYLSTALRITGICTLLCSILLIGFHRYISELIMLSPDYGYVFVIFGLTVFMYALNNLLISVVNGYKEFKRYVRINIANSIFGVAFTATLVLLWHLKGALIAAVSYQSIMLVITILMIRKLHWFRWEFFKDKLSRFISGRYFRYTLMTLTSALTVPVVQMILRGYVMSEISPTEAGWWEGMNRISHMYLMVITSSFGVYYLPRLSELKDPIAIRQEIFKAYKVIIPMLLFGFSVVYLLRFFIIRILFTPQFVPMQQLFAWQMAGDLFKIVSWLLAYLMLAKAMTKWYVGTEIVFSFLYLGLGFLFVHYNGIVGLTQAYLINYIFYSIAMILIFRKFILVVK